MIFLTKLNGDSLVVNSDLIEFIEIVPDSLIITANGKNLRVKESPEEIVKKIIEYKKKVNSSLNVHYKHIYEDEK